MKIYIETYGCTSNKSDEAILRGILADHKEDIVTDPKEADVLIILTCTVIGTTEQRMLSRLKALKKEGKQMIVGGCMPVVQSDLIRAIVPNALLLTPQQVQYVQEALENKPIPTNVISKITFPKKYPTIVAPIAVAEGCPFSCSYCITHYARGQLRSYHPQDIKAEVQHALDQGCREIQLTAQDTASYGMDCGYNLGSLLQEITTISGTYRMRVGMMNPFTAQKNREALLDGFDDPHIYKFLHLPVQSGDNAILKKMNRNYTVEDFVSLVDVFRKHYPDITLATDIIIGFPSETDVQFLGTLQLLQRIRPDIVNITRYSNRPLTEAKKMSGKVPTIVAKERSAKASAYCAEIALEKNKHNIGKHYTILVTEEGKQKTYMGRSENYKPVIVNEEVTLGQLYAVEITGATTTYLVGSLI